MVWGEKEYGRKELNKKGAGDEDDEEDGRDGPLVVVENLSREEETVNWEGDSEKVRWQCGSTGGCVCLCKGGNLAAEVGRDGHFACCSVAPAPWSVLVVPIPRWLHGHLGSLQARRFLESPPLSA